MRRNQNIYVVCPGRWKTFLNSAILVKTMEKKLCFSIKSFFESK